MNKFFKNTNGAITVFVSLLLIPAILISGTAVDLSRIYTARSIIQDANQLAGNSILTQYEAMIQDIYGLYGVMESDPILGDMLNEYIQVSVFGEDGQDKELGSFQLFYGSDVHTAVNPKTDKCLSNPQVIRRQIEEYAKFRAPVIVMEEVWGRIEKFEKLKADSELIEQKMTIDDKVEDIDKIYNEIYDLIEDINKFPETEKSSFDSINGYLTQINGKLRSLDKIRDDWTDAHDDENSHYMSELETDHYNIKRDMELIIKALNKTMDDSKKELEKYIDKMDRLVKRCGDADRIKSELSLMIDELEGKLSSGECSDELVQGMIDSDVIKEYRDLLGHSLKPMAEAMKNKNTSYIESVIEVTDNVDYGKVIDNQLYDPKISRENLRNLPDYIFGIDNIVVKRTIPSTDTKTLSKLAGINYKYNILDDFKLFQDSSFDGTNNNEFYKILYKRYGITYIDIKNKKDDAKTNVNKLIKDSQDLFKTVSLSPDGAKYYKSKNHLDDSWFGNEGDWGNEKEVNNKIQDALKNNIFDKFGDLLNNAGNKLLLLTYGTEMFSNYTTVSGTKTMSGVPMSTDVNYFFQSELEYLYNGNQGSARTNIATVTGLIFLVRFVFNYTSTFVIDEIGYELELISAPTGPYALIVRELARLGYALAESAIDMKELLESPESDVPLFKSRFSQWKFSLHGAVAGTPGKLDDFISKEKDGGKKEKSGTGMYYIDYLRIFLLFEDADTIGHRTSDLITWNITNKKNSINADETTMASAELYDLSKAYTDFTITSTAELRMLFLSMPFAQKGVNGVIPKKNMPVTVVDYRGY